VSLRWIAVVAGGVAATALVGYLVAALLLFPAPLLPNEREVPRVIGATEDEAARALEQKGLKSEIADRQRHATVAAGRVTWQDPAPGVAVPRGSVVSLTVSEGMLLTAVPDVRGLDAALAQQLLWAAGLTVAAVDSIASDQPAGLAVGTAPAAHDSVTTGGSVRLHLSRGTK
jgi:beta-lactam-binding protein with PASTA domain